MSDNEGIQTPAPWPEDLAPLVLKGDTRVLLNGLPPFVDCRVLSEANYQLALRAVNGIALNPIARITIVSYRPDGDDYCRGCHMASSSSDFDLQETTDAEQAAGWFADKLMADHKAEGSLEVREWQVTILINGASYGHDDDDDDGDAEEVREGIENRARLIFAARLDEERLKKEAEQARLKEEADRKKEAARIAKLAHERAEYERLKRVYG